MKFISMKLKETEQDCDTWHMSTIKGNSKESLFKITEDTATKLNNNNIRAVVQIFMTNAIHTIDTTKTKEYATTHQRKRQHSTKKLNHQSTENDFQNKGANIQRDGTLPWIWVRNCYKI